MQGKRTTDQQYIDELKRVAKLLKTDYVSMKKFDKYAKFNANSASNHFGSWSKFIKTVGLKNYAEKNDLVGRTFTRLKVIEKTNKKDSYGNFLWKCECSCPDHNIVYATSNGLKNKNVQSCGCLNKHELNKIERQETLRKGYEKKTDKSGLRYPDFNMKRRSDNKSGYTGVTRRDEKSKWMATLTVKGNQYRLYGFDTAKEAYYNGRIKLEEEYLPENFRKKIQEYKKGTTS